MQGTWVQLLGWEDALEEEMAAHSSSLARKSPWTEEPGASVSFTWSPGVAVFIDGLGGPHLFWGSPGMTEWLRWLRFSLHVPFTLDSSKCDLRIPREPAPMTSTYQASACLKCGDASVIKVSQMAKQ
ncbi:unnamed protein product [Rangifer tarandus platyrhynchus]|uniref:Uncharacterized protein n=1 Tax=Rangifer tarandus platyrhynchus TaxID=3082113 RepID=A0AC59Y7M9_RANTA